jgi:hypothetical protein
VNGKFPLVLVFLLISSTASLSAAPLTRPERDYIAMMTLSVGVTNMCGGYDVDDANVLRFADSRAINIKRLGSATDPMAVSAHIDRLDQFEEGNAAGGHAGELEAIPHQPRHR